MADYLEGREELTQGPETVLPRDTTLGAGEAASNTPEEMPEGTSIEARATINSGEEKGHSMQRLEVGGHATQSIDLSRLFTKDMTESGSFDVRGDIWSTTFGKVMQAVPLAALLIDRSFYIAVANQGCRKISELYEDILDSPFSSLFPAPSTGERVQSILEAVFTDRKPRQVESILEIGENRIWGRITFRSIRIADDRFILTLIEDLTAEREQLRLIREHQQSLKREIDERKRSEDALTQSEARIRRIYDSIPLMMHAFDTNGIIRSVNTKWLEKMGYAQEEVIGKSAYAFLTAECRETLHSMLAGLWQSGEMSDIRLRYVKSDGSCMEILADSVVTEDPSWGQISLMSSRDVTNELILEKQLREAQKMEAVGTLAGGIAHDFNNLLQVILGYADLLVLDADKQSPHYQGLRAIHEAATRGSDLVKQILTFSRRVETHPRPLNLNEEIEEAERLLNRTIPKLIDVELHCADDLRNVFADPTQIQQVILNLALNAKDAMPEGGTLQFATQNVILDETCCRDRPEVLPGNYVSLTVKDTGHGMPKDVLDHIFEPFFTTRESGKGTGLGLSTVFGIVKIHGGHITCESEPGKGTRFEVCLPAMEEAFRSEIATSGEMPLCGDATILIVDDEQLVRKWGEACLTQAGYTVLTARNGQDALELYRREGSRISLVILDLNMPVMDGRRCFEELLEIDPELKIVIASGFAMDMNAKRFLEERAAGFLSKPFKVRELLTTIHKELENDFSEQRDELADR
ncbi:MAG: response regulator [Deltaproteobacteria bacterium]